MSILAHMDEDHDDDVAIAVVEGEIDASNAGEIDERLRSLLTNRSVALVVDLSATTYLDSAGINVLFSLGDRMQGRQQRLALVVGERSPIARMVSITGLDRVVAVHDTRPAALQAVRT